MSAVDWDREFTEPWRTLGKEWCEMLFAISNGGVARPPETRRYSQWDGADFRQKLRFFRIKNVEAARALRVSADTIWKWTAGKFPPSRGRQLAIRQMFADAERKRQQQQ